VIIGDNGASAEGTPQGTFNEMIVLNGLGAIETPEFLAERIDKWGTPEAYNHYAVGWAHAMDTPYQWTKQVASHWGGTRNGTIVHWPAGIRAKNAIRSQFAHVIDVVPTVLEVAGLPAPTFVHGVQQSLLPGASMAYFFDDPDAAERHETQYFEMFGNRAIYHKGWTAATKHQTPWIMVGRGGTSFDDDVWELYDTSKDWTQARDLAAQHPDKLEELQRLWLIEAARHGVLPLDDRGIERADAGIAGRPTLIKGTRQLLFGGMGRLSENSVVNIKNRSHAVTAEVVIERTPAQGVIVAQGGSIGGWSLYAKDGRPKYCYNLLGINRFYVDGTKEIPRGTHQVRMEFDYDGGGMGKGGTVRLFIDGENVGESRVDATAALVFSADDTCDVGREGGSLVTTDYPLPNAFNGVVRWVEIDVGDTIGAKGTGHVHHYTITGLAEIPGVSSGSATLAALDVSTAQVLLGKQGRYDSISVVGSTPRSLSSFAFTMTMNRIVVSLIGGSLSPARRPG
jgi:arylsulfatase